MKYFFILFHILAGYLDDEEATDGLDGMEESLDEGREDSLDEGTEDSLDEGRLGDEASRARTGLWCRPPGTFWTGEMEMSWTPVVSLSSSVESSNPKLFLICSFTVMAWWRALALEQNIKN